jgi:two-component system, response regulator
MKQLPMDILILEDDPNDLELTMRSLQKISPESKILTAVDGVEALDLLFVDGKNKIERINDVPKFILVDLKVPRINGHEFIKTVKANDVLKIIPIVVFSSSNQEEDIVLAYQNGANSYVVKPVRFEHYQSTVSSIASFWLTINRSINN